MYFIKRCLINKVGSARKEKKMEQGMTNEQFQVVIKMIIQILKDDNVKPETIKKIEDLIK